MPYVTGAAVLQHAALSGSPSAEAPDVAWADDCAEAVDGAIVHRLRGATPGAELAAELTRAALQDATMAYLERRAPHGVLQLGDGQAARLGADILRATVPVLARHLAAGGIGIGG